MNLDQDVGLFDGSEVGPLLNRNNDAVEKVFSNTLIWKIIGSYLNVGDLKACRLVSSGFHGMVMKETNFLQRCVVSMKPDQITRNIFGSTSELWKNVLLEFQNPGEGSYCNFSNEDLENLDWLFPVLSNVESLSLRMKEGTKGGNFFRLLQRLLLAPKKLRSLAMEPIFLICATEGHFEVVEDEILRNLEEFEILQPSPEWMMDVDSWEYIDPSFFSIDFTNHLRSVRVVKSYYPQMFHLPLTRTELATFRECKILTSVLTGIAMVSSRTLIHVTLGEVTPTANGFFHSPLFFEAFPMLQELDLSVYVRGFPMKILNVIEEKSDCLRKLKLESWNFQGTRWEFLERTKLEEFQLGVLECGYGTGALPSGAQNYWPSTIRRLYMQGRLESNPVPALTRLDPTLVTQLTFIDSGNCFGDDATKYVCQNFVMLRKLNVTNASVTKVTDAGFIGSSSWSGSLSGIKGLRTLILRECGSITDATLVEIRFLELSYLDLSYNENLTEDGLEGVLSNNPSLETLVTSSENLYRNREHLCASHPRLSCVKFREEIYCFDLLHI